MSLLERSVRDFVDAVASESEPVPAGACAAALTGSLSAALLVLVCRLLRRRRNSPDVEALLEQAAALQVRLSGLIDADADAYQAYVSASGAARADKLIDATRTPLDIAAACAELLGIARSVRAVASGSILSDAQAAVTIAEAAARAALDTAAANIASLDASPRRAALEHESEALRARLG